MGYNIISESQLIDVGTINAGCDKIASAGQFFDNCAKEIETASDMCHMEVLSVDKKSMQPIMFEIADQIRGIKGLLEGFSDSIRGVATQIYKEQYAQLQAYRESLKKDENPESEEEE